MHEDEPLAGARGGQSPEAKSPAGDLLKALTPARYLAWLYSTDAQKPVLAALLEIETEIASGLRAGIEHHVAHARLQWWSEEAERVAQGRPVHPLGRELVKARASAGGSVGEVAPGANISGLVDTAVWDLASATFETRKELTAYCERWAAAMFETAVGAGGATRSAAGAAVSGAGPGAHGLMPSATPTAVELAAAAGPSTSPWKTLGAAVREIELLADAAREAHAGRVRVPLDELERASLEPNALAKLPWPAPLTALLKERHQTLRATLTTSVASLTSEDQMASRGLLVWAALTWRQSLRAQHALPNVVLPRRYDALADGWRAWRAARRAAAGKLRMENA